MARTFAASRRGQVSGADDIGGEPHRRPGVEAREGDDVGDESARGYQRGAEVAQLGARADQHEQRDAAPPLDEVLDEVEQQRLRPLEVVDHEHDRVRVRQRRE